MIYRNDIINTDQPEQFILDWQTALQSLSSMRGFADARLYKVYRQINKTGYDLISSITWDDRASYDSSGANPGSYAHFGDGFRQDGSSLYTLVNQGRGSGARNPGNLIITNPYRISSQDAEQHFDMWDASKRHMESREGFVCADLFRCISDTNEYYYLSRAEWSTEELFMRQFEGRDFKQIIAPYEDIFAICLSRLILQANRPLMGTYEEVISCTQ